MCDERCIRKVALDISATRTDTFRTHYNAAMRTAGYA